MNIDTIRLRTMFGFDLIKFNEFSTNAKQLQNCSRYFENKIKEQLAPISCNPPTQLESTKSLVSKQRQNMGNYAHTRYLKNLGLSFEETYSLIFGKEPKK